MSTPAPEPKRRKLSLQVSLEAGADGRPPVHQVFPDGSYIPAVHSHFERTSAAASAFVARALAPQPAVSVETRATDSDPSARWAASVVTDVEGALYELARAIAVIEALRAATPLLELRRTAARRPDPAAPRVSGPVARDGKAILMAKRRAMTKCADLLADRGNALSRWLDADNAFCDTFLQLRRRCNGVRRTPDGTPLIDVGDGDFVRVHRAPEAPDPDDDRRACVLHIPATTFLRFGVNTVEQDYTACAAPVVIEGPSAGDHSVKGVIRRIRLARIANFRRKTFEHFTEEVANARGMTELTTNTLGVESGPIDLVRMEKTQRPGTAPSLEIGTDPTQPVPPNLGELQVASLLQIISTHACLTQTIALNQPPQLLDRLVAASMSRTLLHRTEAVLDDAVRLLRVRLEWTRGPQRAEETRVRVFSTAADGDGPARALATIEPISSLNNGGETLKNGHVRVIPAFGVIIPAPDDPSARGRGIAPHSSSSTGASALGLDDVPRSYICPVGGEIMSVLTLLLCIRLLDALETAARAGVEEMLDVDRQCFTVIVSSPSTGRTLKAKAWPRGPGVGREVPGATAWLDGKRVESFPAVGPERVKAWRALLRRLVTDEEGRAVPGVQVQGMQGVHGLASGDGATAGASTETGDAAEFSFDQKRDATPYRFDL